MKGDRIAKLQKKSMGENRERYYIELWVGTRRIFKSTSDGGNYSSKDSAERLLNDVFPDFKIVDCTVSPDFTDIKYIPPPLTTHELGGTVL